MRVLMLTRRVDKDDWLAGFAHTWIERLAAHPQIEHVNVICLERGTVGLPDNVGVASMGKESGASRLAELWNFQRAIAPVIRHADVIFGHMIPRYTLVAAPWALMFSVPVVQWYTHKQPTFELRLAHMLAKRIVTASLESYPLPSSKVSVLGHGIDLSRFRPAESPSTEPLVVAVGRLSPIKHYEALIEATAQLITRPGFENVRVAIAGGSTPQDGEAYTNHLRTLAAECGVKQHVDFLGPVPHEDIPALYRRAAVTVNLCPTGGVDKVVLESMASGVPAVVRNETFLPLLASDRDMLWCADLDPGRIADRLAGVLSSPPTARIGLGTRLSERVRADYDLDAFIGRLVGVFEEVTAKRGKR
jgi:glycosyltransferase involved in cell wall biosynthesis